MAICTLLAALVGSLALGSPHREVLHVKQVISERNSLFGAEISLKGYLVTDFENINVYESRGDFEENTGKCVTVGVNDVLQRDAKKYNHKVVVIRGLLKSNYVEEGTACLSCCSDYAILPSSISSH